MRGRVKMRRTDEFCGLAGSLHREALRGGELDKEEEECSSSPVTFEW